MGKIKNHLPYSVKIGPIQYTIVYDDTLVKVDNLLGNIDETTGIITLQSEINNYMMIRILMHEIIHGIFDATGESKYNEEEYEPFVERISTALADTLINSPELLKYLNQF